MNRALDEAGLFIPPHDIGAEQAVLCAVLIDPASVNRVSDWLRSSDFYRADHGLIFDAVAQMVEQGKIVDLFTLVPFLRESGVDEDTVPDNLVLDLHATAASSANIIGYAEIVLERSRLRQLMDAAHAMSSAALAGRSSSAEIVTGTVERLSSLTRDTRGGLAAARGALATLFADVSSRWESGGKMIGIPTPWRDLNDLLGGLRPGVFYIIAGRPSMGKSVLSVQLGAFSALRGVHTAMFSVEMTAAECMQRACAAVGDIPHAWIDRPASDTLESDSHWARLGDAIAALNAAPLVIDETPALRHEQMTARARREHHRSPLGLVIVDHLHDMYRDPKRDARFVYGDIAQAGKSLAKELNVPVVMFAQLNRSVAGRSDKRPQMTDLRESGELEQKADVILFVHREDYYDPDVMPGAVEIIPAKGRNIPVGRSIVLQNDYAHMRLLDWHGPTPERARVASRSSGRDRAAGGFE